MNIHPGASVALRRLGWNELDIARAMAAGELASPQRYHNVTLYNLRITGTGVSYRPQHDEFVYRRPENYLSEEFLARCNGLPVIMVHPEKSLLNSDEFADRIVGTMFLPYVKDDEVWGIAKLYDDDTIALLSDEQMSTSPAVLLGKSDKLQMQDGTKLLVEGNATLLDHLAIVRNGVWDKGGEASGIETDIRKDAAMAENEMEKKEREEKERADAARADAARADAEKRMDEKFDLLLKGIDACTKAVDACNSRMDAMERDDKARKDAEEEERKKADAGRRKDGEDGEDPEASKAAELAADKARKDAEERAEEERKKADAARADSVELRKQLSDQAEQIKALAARIPKSASDADYGNMVALQVRADDVYAKFGERAPPPMSSEDPAAYERRLVGGLQKHSDRWKDLDISKITEKAAFDQIRDQIYVDAAERAKRPNDIAGGKIISRTRQTNTGHTITEFFGTDAHFVRQFSRPARRVASFTLPTSK